MFGRNLRRRLLLLARNLMGLLLLQSGYMVRLLAGRRGSLCRSLPIWLLL